MLRVLSYVIFFMLCGLFLGCPAGALSEAPRVHVFSCQVVSGVPIVPQADEIGLVVRFQNDSPQALNSIVWRANFGRTPVDFIDDGTFSPGVRIDNGLLFERGHSRFNWTGAIIDAILIGGGNGRAANQPLTKVDLTLPPFRGSEDPENCSIVRATFASGEIWKNAALTQEAAVLPTPTPAPSLRQPSFTQTHPAPVTIGPTLPVAVQNCSLEISGYANLFYEFRNLSERVADSVTIRAAYLKDGLDFTDVGTFSKDVLIRHNLRFKLPAVMRLRQFASMPGSDECMVASVHYIDGTSWQNPLTPPTPEAYPTMPPDAISLGITTPAWKQRHAMPTPLPSASPQTATP